MSKPESLPPMTCCPKGGTSIQTGIRHITDSCDYKKYSATLHKFRRLSLGSIQVQGFAAEEQKIDTAFVFFYGFLSLRSIGLREKISLESCSVCVYSITRGARPSENILRLERSLSDNKFLSSGDAICFLVAHSNPSQFQARVWGDGVGTDRAIIFFFFFFRVSIKNLIGAIYPTALLKTEVPEYSDLHLGPHRLGPSISLMPFPDITNGWIDLLDSHVLS